MDGLMLVLFMIGLKYQVPMSKKSQLMLKKQQHHAFLIKFISFKKLINLLKMPKSPNIRQKIATVLAQVFYKIS